MATTVIYKIRERVSIYIYIPRCSGKQNNPVGFESTHPIPPASLSIGAQLMIAEALTFIRQSSNLEEDRHGHGLAKSDPDLKLKPNSAKEGRFRRPRLPDARAGKST